MEFIFEEINDLNIELDIMYPDLYIESEVYTESMNPVKAFKKKIEEIKKSKPKEYSSDDEVKLFVDKNYNDIMKCADILEKEPEKLRKEEYKTLVASILGFIGYFGGLIAGAAAKSEAAMLGGLKFAVASLLISFIYTMIKSVIVYVRSNDDRAVMNDLNKIQTSLSKVDTKKLSKDQQNKIKDMRTAISDAQEECDAKFKVKTESGREIYDKVFNAVQEKVDNGEISFEDGQAIVDRAYDRYVTEAFEGARDINKLLADCKKEYADNIKDIKKAIKSGNIDIAKRNIQSAKKNITEASKIVDSIPTDASDNVLGFLVETVNRFVKITLADAYITGIIVGTIFTVGAYVMSKNPKAYGIDLDDVSDDAVKKAIPATGVMGGVVATSAKLNDNLKNKKTLGGNAAIALTGAALASLIRYKKGKDANYYKSYAKKQFATCMKHLDKLDKKLNKKQLVKR